MVEKTVQIQNIMGLHARPAARFVKVATKYPCHIEITKDDLTADGKSILGIMSLAAEKGSVVTIRASGDEEEEAAASLIALLNETFDEEEIKK